MSNDKTDRDDLNFRKGGVGIKNDNYTEAVKNNLDLLKQLAMTEENKVDNTAEVIWKRASQKHLVELFKELEDAQIAQVCNYGLKTVLFEEKLKEIKKRYVNVDEDDAID